jgi:hypothetical protein
MDDPLCYHLQPRTLATVTGVETTDGVVFDATVGGGLGTGEFHVWLGRKSGTLVEIVDFAASHFRAY